MFSQKTISPPSHHTPPFLDKAVNSFSKGESTNSVQHDYDPRLERAWRKIDFRVVPIVAIFYLLAFLDRGNLGNARVAGMQKELKLTNHQYTIALTVTFIPYFMAQLPSNLILKRVGPNILLPAMLTLWGIITTLQGFVKNYTGLLVCRFFLGVFEGGVFPGLVLYLSFWYPREALQKRVSVLFSTSSLALAFSGLLAYGIVRMDGVGDRSGWSWIFILEGVFTTVFGLSGFILLPRSPQHSRFLREEEKAYILSRLCTPTAFKEEESFSWGEVAKTYALPHVMMIGISLFFSGTISQGMSYFSPTIIHDLGYTAVNAQLYSVPPFALAFVVNIIAGFISDGFGVRGLVAIFSSLLCTIGFSLYIGCASPHVKYGSLFFSITGSHTATPTLLTWMANNSVTHTHRATALAFGTTMITFGSLLVLWLFGTLSHPPLYTKATFTLLVSSVVIALFTGATLGYLVWENRKKQVIRNNIESESEKIGLSDRSAWFVYNL